MRPERVGGAGGRAWAAGRAGGPHAGAVRARKRGGGGGRGCGGCGSRGKGGSGGVDRVVVDKGGNWLWLSVGLAGWNGRRGGLEEAGVGGGEWSWRRCPARLVGVSVRHAPVVGAEALTPEAPDTQMWLGNNCSKEDMGFLWGMDGNGAGWAGVDGRRGGRCWKARAGAELVLDRKQAARARSYRTSRRAS